MRVLPPGDDGAGALDAGDETFGDKDGKGVAHGVPGRRKLRRQVLLAGQQSVREGTPQHLAPQYVRDLPRPVGAPAVGVDKRR